MKTWIKNLLLSITMGVAIGSVLVLPTQLHAANVAFTLGASGTNVLVDGPVHINSITVINSETRAGGTNYLLRFFDSTNTVQVTNNVGAYTNFTFAVQTNLTTQTDIFGVTTTNSYTVIRRTTNSIPSTNYSYRTLAVMNVISNTTQTLTFNDQQLCVIGLLITNAFGSAGNVIVEVDYNRKQ